MALFLNDTGDAHCSGEAYHCDDAQADRQFVTDHLGAGAECSDEGELVVGRPSGQQDTQYAYG